MLLCGTANPDGMSNEYLGIFLNTDDIKSMVRKVEDANSGSSPISVHLEHKGVQVGHIVSAWAHRDTLQCVSARVVFVAVCGSSPRGSSECAAE
jgi:hypothetical protein